MRILAANIRVRVIRERAFKVTGTETDETGWQTMPENSHKIREISLLGPATNLTRLANSV